MLIKYDFSTVILYIYTCVHEVSSFPLANLELDTDLVHNILEEFISPSSLEVINMQGYQSNQYTILVKV